MALVGFQYEPLSLNEVCFDEEKYISDTYGKSRKTENVIGW